VQPIQNPKTGFPAYLFPIAFECFRFRKRIVLNPDGIMDEPHGLFWGPAPVRVRIAGLLPTGLRYPSRRPFRTPDRKRTPAPNTTFTLKKPGKTFRFRFSPRFKKNPRGKTRGPPGLNRFLPGLPGETGGLPPRVFSPPRVKPPGDPREPG
jgi:hypothetical protein